MSLISVALGIGKLIGLGSLIGKWLGGDKGEYVANKVIDIAQTVTDKSTIDEAMDALTNSDKLQQKMRDEITANQLEFEKLSADDRKDAREMQEITLKQDDVFLKRFVCYFAIYWSLVAAAYVFAISLGTVPVDSKEYIKPIMGALGAIIAGFMMFFYGTSVTPFKNNH
ncbi:TPA: hypothetical protein ACX6QP_002176 [Photobacterium damselae]